MGLFGSLFSQKKKTVARRNAQADLNKSLAQLRAERDADDRHFNMVMDKVNSASEACNNTDSSDEALEEYRRVIEWAREEGVNLSTAHDFRLINGYIKRGKHDAAWGYLNAMSLKHPDDLWKIRREMCRICKKEGRWVDALGFLMMSHASKYGGFNESAFTKDLGPIARKLSLSDDEVSYLIDMLGRLRGDEMKRDADASKLHRQFYEERLKPRLG